MADDLILRDNLNDALHGKAVLEAHLRLHRIVQHYLAVTLQDRINKAKAEDQMAILHRAEQALRRAIGE